MIKDFFGVILLTLLMTVTVVILINTPERPTENNMEYISP